MATCPLTLAAHDEVTPHRTHLYASVFNKSEVEVEHLYNTYRLIFNNTNLLRSPVELATEEAKENIHVGGNLQHKYDGSVGLDNGHDNVESAIPRGKGEGHKVHRGNATLRDCPIQQNMS